MRNPAFRAARNEVHVARPMNEDAALYDLAPTNLPNCRVRRYHGDDLCLPMAAFASEDSSRLRRLYDFLQELLVTLAASSPDIRPTPALVDLLERTSPDELVALASSFGRESYAADPSPRMAKTIHDLRGGGLTPLLAQLQLAQWGGLEKAPLNSLYFLTRDHLKIMRNALLGLDDEQREEDLRPKLHGTDLIVQKWHGASLPNHGRAIRLSVECRQRTAISECCVEFGALDRILYNLMNNACRHAASDEIRLVLLPVPDAEGDNLRFVLLNEVGTKDLAFLKQTNLDTLFDERTSTTGSGYGLPIVKEFVTNAFGLEQESEAVTRGYLGARLLGSAFAVWFHWPRIVED
jgi:hypothetical protein